MDALAAAHGDGRWNGVALLSAVGLDDVSLGFPGEPGYQSEPGEPTLIDEPGLRRPEAPDGGRHLRWDPGRAGMFAKDNGMRIDLAYATEAVAGRVRAAYVDREARKGNGPSDHAPVVVDLS